MAGRVSGGVDQKRISRKHTVEVLEVGQLDALAHAEDVGRSAKAVDQHPEVTGIEGGHLAGGVTTALNGVLNIGPGVNERAEDHQTEREESQGGD